MAINPHTYDSIKTAAVPHGVGSVWAEMLWEMTYALIDEYGFNANLITGTAGNNISLQLVMDGMKLQPCSPGFVDARNAILAADQANYGGANQCLHLDRVRQARPRLQRRAGHPRAASPTAPRPSTCRRRATAWP